MAQTQTHRRQEPTPKTIVRWDVRNWSRPLRYWQQHSQLDFNGRAALELGANRGGLSLWLASLGADVVCSDIQQPGPDVRAFHAQYSGSERIAYAQADASTLPFDNDCFDLVIFKSVLGAMRQYDRQEKMIAEILRVLKPAGELWFAENLVASPLHQWARRLFVTWGKSWRYLTLHELEALLTDFGDHDLRSWGFFGAFGRQEWQRQILSLLDTALCPLLPPSTHYLAYGIARKSRPADQNH